MTGEVGVEEVGWETDEDNGGENEGRVNCHLLAGERLDGIVVV